MKSTHDLSIIDNDLNLVNKQNLFLQTRTIDFY